MAKTIWILNHYAGSMISKEGGRHYWFAKFLKKAGYKTVVFCANSGHDKGGEPYFTFDGLWEEHIAEKIDIPFIYVKARAYKSNGKDRILNMYDFYKNVKKAAKQYAERTEKPDVILASSVHPLTLVAGLKLAKHFGVKCICEVRDLWPESIVAYSKRWTRTSPLMRVLYREEKRIYTKADKVIMTWPGGYDYIVEQGWDKQIPLDKVVYIPNGLDLAEFEKNAAAEICPDPELLDMSKKKFVYTGAIRQVNNLGMIVDAAKILWDRGFTEAEILIYGGGVNDESEELSQKVKSLELDNIKFRGRIPKTQIPSALRKADFTLLHNSSTSLDKYGQSQNKFFEYLGAGKPILMTYAVGHSVVKERGCGVELEKQGPTEIADAIEKLCSLPEETYQQYASHSHETAKDFDFANLTEKLIDVIESL